MQLLSTELHIAEAHLPPVDAALTSDASAACIHLHLQQVATLW